MRSQKTAKTMTKMKRFELLKLTFGIHGTLGGRISSWIRKLSRYERRHHLILTLLFSLSVILQAIPANATTCTTSGNDITIAANCIFDAGTYTFTGTLTINAGVTVTAASNVGNGQVVIVSDNIIVNGTISADGTGLSSGGGSGTSVGTAGGGAHGGDGGDGSTDTNSGGNANDSVTAPVGLGGAGGDDPNNGANPTAPGAGSIKLSAPRSEARRVG